MIIYIEKSPKPYKWQLLLFKKNNIWQGSEDHYTKKDN